jgi:hypothetical protein
MIELWFDEIPNNPTECNQDSCQEILDLIEKRTIIPCTGKNTKEWRITLTNWKKFFDDILGIGKFERTRASWFMPLQKEKDGLDYEARSFLSKPPVELLRLALERNEETIISTALEFERKFKTLTAGSKHIHLYDRYLLGIQQELIDFEDGKIGHNLDFDENDFSRNIRSINLILHSLPRDVEKLTIYSDMLDYRTFKNTLRQHGLEIEPKKFYSWANNSHQSKQAAMKHITSKLIAYENRLEITFYDCWDPESEYSQMEHDRYVKISQNRSFISSGGFNGVWKDLQNKDLENISLNPKTFIMQVPTAESMDKNPPNLRRIHKTKNQKGKWSV